MSVDEKHSWNFGDAADSCAARDETRANFEGKKLFSSYVYILPLIAEICQHRIKMQIISHKNAM